MSIINIGSLQLKLFGNKCVPVIVLNSIASMEGNPVYIWKDGQISIDSVLLKKGILKAQFDFKFKHDENPKQDMFWKGSIYANVNKE